jgi:hypothetical protein
MITIGTMTIGDIIKAVVMELLSATMGIELLVVIMTKIVKIKKWN